MTMMMISHGNPFPKTTICLFFSTQRKKKNLKECLPDPDDDDDDDDDEKGRPKARLQVKRKN
jgi:hypothetical protein